MKTMDVKPNVSKQKLLTINRVLNLSLKSVWKAWSEPESFKKWWGPNDYTCPYCEIDFSIGGKYLADMKGPDGKETWSTGQYMEIIPLKKIVYSDSFSDDKGNKLSANDVGMPGDWPLESKVTVELEEKNGKTSMRLVHEGIPEEMKA
ncbi:MAG TPA: SRPBCC domain-containing protein, partial [Saprospiraceae bacterium]|nr:SRPBCC domain-containing protein [Saprospiraceae bacterium]